MYICKYKLTYPFLCTSQPKMQLVGTEGEYAGNSVPLLLTILLALAVTNLSSFRTHYKHLRSVGSTAHTTEQAREYRWGGEIPRSPTPPPPPVLSTICR